MKTIIRVGSVLDNPERFAEEKIPTMATRLLAEAYAAKRKDRPEAFLLLDKGKDGEPVYITVGGSPPELCAGSRQVWAVFSPPESQEPLATFFEEAAARTFASLQLDASRVGRIDSTDAPHVQTVVAVILQREGKTLIGRLQNGIWCLPEGLLEVGETLDSAAQRVMLRTVGLAVTKLSISRSVPYVNTYFEATGHHFVTLVMLAEDPPGSPALQLLDKQWTEWGFYKTEEAPTPLLVTVQQMIGIAARYTAAQKQLPPPIVTEAPARLSGKHPPRQRSRSR